MKKLITILSARIGFLMLMVCFACIGIRSNATGTLTNTSWSANNLQTDSTGIYTFNYTVATASPNTILYANFPTGFAPTSTSDITVTINGTTAAQSGSSVSGTLVIVKLSNAALATAGANVVVTMKATNNATAGMYGWTNLYTATSGGIAVDTWSSPDSIAVKPSTLGNLTFSSQTSSSFTVRALRLIGEGVSAYYLDVATDSAFTNFVTGYNNLNTGVTVPGAAVTGLSPFTIYYCRLRSVGGGVYSDYTPTRTVTTLKISATITLGSLTQTYTGSALNATATTVPSGVSVTFTYNGSSTAPVTVGTYSVLCTVANPSYSGSRSGTMTIVKDTVAVSLSNLTPSYDGSAHGATVTTTPNGLTVNVTYNGSSTVPSAVGTYSVVATVVDSNYTGSKTGSLVISKGAATVALGNLSSTYDGSSKAASATTTPSGFTVNVTYNGSSTAPVNAGTYTVIGTISDSSFQGSDTSTMIISKASSAVWLGNLSTIYNGSSQSVADTTAPTALNVNLTYNGSSTMPVTAGTYSVVATIVDSNYQGSDSAIFTISKATAGVTLDSLATVYDGTSKPVVVSTTPSGLTVTITYNDSSSAPVNEGTYSVVATIVDSNYTGTASGTLAIAKATATITLDSLATVYDGTSKPVVVSTSPSGLTVNVTYNDSSTVPVNAGTYSVIATVVDSNYVGTASGTLAIAKATASVTLDSLSTVYDGTSKPVVVSTAPSGLTVNVTYNDSSSAPTNAGSYSVVATIVDSNYVGTASGSLAIAKATAGVTLDSLATVYDGTSKPVVVSTTPSGLTVNVNYNDSSSAPMNAGSYSVVATIVDSNYTGTASGSLEIAKATAGITLDSLATVYDGASKPVVVFTTPSGLAVNVTYNDSSSAPMNAGSYSVVATIVDSNYMGTASGSLEIAKATAGITLDSLATVYDGASKPVVVFTTPSGLAVNVTYNDSSSAPVNAGSYSVVATIVDSNYAGTASGTLAIAKAIASITLDSLATVYDGTSKPVVVSTTPSGLTVNVTYNDSSTAPVNAGSYSVAATINDSNYAGSVIDTLFISKATASVSLGALVTTYNDSTHTLNVTTVPSGLTVDVTYNGSSTAPVNAGSYAVTATVNDSNYTGSASGAFTIYKATPVITIDSIHFTYDGSAKSVSVSTVPAHLTYEVLYNGSVTLPVNAGSYVVQAAVIDSNYSGEATDTLQISKANASVSFGNLSAAYNGSAHSVTATTTPNGLTVNLTYNGSSTEPVNAGKYSVVATVVDSNYTGSATDSLVINKATATVMLDSTTAVYDGTVKSIVASTIPSGLNVAITYNDSSAAPTAAGTYSITATVNDSNYTGSTSGTLVIAKATASVFIDFGSLQAVYDGTGKQVLTATSPTGLNVDVTYNGSSTAPVNAGSYRVVATINDSNYKGSVIDTMVIGKATASVFIDFGSLSAMYDGTGKQVLIATSPQGLNVGVTYNGSSTTPVNAGSYRVVATINDSNYIGSVTDTMTIAKATASVFIDFGSLSATYDGTAKQVLTATSPTGLNVDVTYNGSSTAPVNAGSYIVVATVNDSNYTGTIIDTMIIAKATATVEIDYGSLFANYDGSAQPVLTATVPSGLTLDVTYNGSSTVPTNAGIYTVVAMINDSNYQGSLTDTMIIAKGVATILLSNLNVVYTGTSVQVIATITSSSNSLPINITYDGLSTLPVNAGKYAVVATVVDSNYQGIAADTLVIAKASAAISFGNLDFMYDGSAKAVSATTTPSALTVDYTYDGSSTAPSSIGTYTVVATINDVNYQGSDTATMVITITTGIEEQSSLSDVKLYPNPATDYILVRTSEAIRKITMLNLNGANVLVKESCTQEENLNVKGLSKGIYFLEVETSTGKSTHRIVLN